MRLRWRRSPELDPTTARMVDLLATRPDLRLEEDERELRRALSDRLDEARALQPDVPYRQLIADTLDYKQWHEMSVILRREGGKETRLNRRTPLSEGEKKIVTYLPLFAAVAASYDALAEQQGTPDGRRERHRPVRPARRRLRQGVRGQPRLAVRTARHTRPRPDRHQRAALGHPRRPCPNSPSPRSCAMRASA